MDTAHVYPGDFNANMQILLPGGAHEWGGV